MWLSDAVICTVFYQFEAMAPTLPFSTIVVAGHMHSLGFPAVSADMAFLTLVLTDLELVLHSRPILSACVKP